MTIFISIALFQTSMHTFSITHSRIFPSRCSKYFSVVPEVVAKYIFSYEKWKQIIVIVDILKKKTDNEFVTESTNIQSILFSLLEKNKYKK